MSDNIPKGTLIICPRKRHSIGVLNAGFSTDGPLKLSIIDFTDGQERIAGESLECKICSSMYYQQGRIYTSTGWEPKDPRLEPVKR